VSKPITARDLEEFSEALEQNPLLKYQMGSASKMPIRINLNSNINLGFKTSVPNGLKH
jgi:hypothetical protein